MPRETLVFLHIIKTGGTSLRRAMEACFAPGAVYPGSSEQAIEADGPRTVRARYALVMAHCGYAFASETGHRLVTLLRDPVDRILSVYNYWRSAPEPEGGFTDDAPRLAREMSFSRFIRSDIDRIVADIHDAQAHALALGNAARWRRRLKGLDGAERLALAERNLRTMDVIGATERLDRFAVEMRLRLGLDLDIARENVTGQRAVGRGDLTRRDRRRLDEITGLDRRLHDRVLAGEIAPDPLFIADRRSRLDALA